MEEVDSDDGFSGIYLFLQKTIKHTLPSDPSLSALPLPSAI